MPNTVVEPELEQEKRELGSMSLLQHIEELRKRLIYSLAAVGVCFGVGWYYADRIFARMSEPIKTALANHHYDTKLVVTSPTDAFNLYLKIGLIAGIFIASPMLLYQVWMFISPGLYRREKRFVFPFLFVSVGLFLGGGAFGFKIVYPVALDFLIGYSKDFQPMMLAHSYTDLFLTIILGLALIFELPIVIGFAAMMGVVSARFLFKHIRGAVFLCFVVAAVLTPTTDIMNMTIYAAPMIFLYLGSIAIAWFVHPDQRRKRKEKREKGST
ncbi:MAG TPA: twin-arginine translocase subunit TatC [Candidatus Angelobacter sp.]